MSEVVSKNFDSNNMQKILVVRKISEEIYFPNAFNYHIKVVVKNALFLAKKLNEKAVDNSVLVDSDVVEVASYLHDIGLMAKCGGNEIGASENEHHLIGAEKCKKILSEIGFDDAFIQKVSDCILTHRARKGSSPKTIEQKIVANADAMAHIESFLNLFSAFAEDSTSFKEALETVEEKIKRDWDKKLTIPEAKEKVRETYEAIILLINKMKEYC
jgi:putative nucleotidyltransferase with HDIG domain